MTYRPHEFWQQRLSEQFDLRGTGEPGLSLDYNRACYAMRRRALDRALADAGLDPRGSRVLDVGCGTGFFTAYYVERGAHVTGIDIAPASVERLAARFPQATFRLLDVGEATLAERYDIVNVFDVLYHITDDARWARALRTVADAVAPGGALLVTDTFFDRSGLAEHNKSRSLERYREVLDAAGLTMGRRYPTHVLLNRELGGFRFLNRLPGLLYAMDLLLMPLGWAWDPQINQLLVSRRPGPSKR